MEWYFVFRIYKIWYFDFPLTFAIWYFYFVSAIILIFHLLQFMLYFGESYNFEKIFVEYLWYLFSFCNLVLCLSLLLHSGSVCLLIMANERDDSLQSMSVRLDGKNYLYWSYVMRNFLKGKKMWGYISETYVIPKNTDEGVLFW